MTTTCESVLSAVFSLFKPIGFIGYILLWLFYNADVQLTRAIEFLAILPVMTWDGVALGQILSSSISNFNMDMQHRYPDSYGLIIVGVQALQHQAVELFELAAWFIFRLREAVAKSPVLEWFFDFAMTFSFTLCLILTVILLILGIDVESYLYIGLVFSISLLKFDQTDFDIFMALIVLPVSSDLVYYIQLIKPWMIRELLCLIMLIYTRNRFLIPVLRFAYWQFVNIMAYLYIRCDMIVSIFNIHLEMWSRELYNIIRTVDVPRPFLPRHILTPAVWDFIYINLLQFLLFILMFMRAIIRRIRFGPVIENFWADL